MNIPSEHSPVLEVYFDTDRVIRIRMKDDQQGSFDFDAFDSISLNVFRRSNQLEPEYTYQPTIDGDDLLFEISREDAKEQMSRVLYYELEFVTGGKRGVWIANRYISRTVPDTTLVQDVEITLSDELIVLDVEGSVNTAQAVEAKAAAESARDEAQDAAEGFKDYVDDKASLYSVLQIGLNGSGSAHDSSLLNDFISSNSPRTLFFPAGEWELENISVKSGWSFVGDGDNATKIMLPTGATNPLFKEKDNTPELLGVHWINMELAGIGSGYQDCIDLSNADRLQQSSIKGCYVHHFNRGFIGSENDRYFMIDNNRFWHNDIGVYVKGNHPIFYFSDIRDNRIGVGGEGIFDAQFIGTKFNYNEIGLTSGASNIGIKQCFLVGCQFFGNSDTSIFIEDRVSITGCLFAATGGVGQNFIKINNNDNVITGNIFRNQLASGSLQDYAILMDGQGSAGPNNNSINGNVFENLELILKIGDNSNSVRNLSFQNNSFNKAHRIIFCDNYLQTSRITGNGLQTIDTTNPSAPLYYNAVSNSAVGSVFMGNTIQFNSDNYDGYVIDGSWRGCIIKNNIIRRSGGLIAPSAITTDSIIADNIENPIT